MSSPSKNLPDELKVLGTLYDKAAEEILIAHAIGMAGNTAVVKSITPGEFWNGHHRRIWQAIRVLHNNGKPADVMSVAAEVAGEADSYKEAAFLAGLVARVIDTTAYEWALKRVKDLARRRGLLIDLENKVGQLLDVKKDLSTIIASIRSSLDGITIESASSTLTAKQVVDEALAGKKLGRLVDSITFGSKVFNNAIIPMGGTFHIIAARTGIGKSTMLINLARGVSRRGGKSVLVTLEMPHTQLLSRMLAADTGLNAKQIQLALITGGKRGGLSKKDFATIRAAAEQIGEQFYIIDARTMTLDQIEAQIRSIHERVGGLDVVFLDYIGLLRNRLTGVDASLRGEQELSRISTRLSMLADALDVYFIAAHQLNREVERRSGNGRPMLSDLRGSGKLEQDADIVWFLWVEEAAQALKQQNKPYLVTVTMEKNRNGEVAEVHFLLTPHTQRFTIPSGVNATAAVNDNFPV